MTADLAFDPSIPVAEAQSETDEIVYRISHDLRASVRALQELPTWISEDLDKSAVVLPKPTGRHLELIASHASRLDLMLTGLLEYSRIGRMQPISAIRLAEVLQEVVEDLCLPGDATLNARMDGGAVQIGHADAARIFFILISNAVRFHPTHAPTIDVSGGPVGDGVWQIEVADDGVGIPAEKRAFVQRPMTKLVSRDVDPGAGMGLAVLKKIADVYGGDVEIGAPKTGVGTRVTVRLRVT
jgi:signal transduction histidine kinase